MENGLRLSGESTFQLFPAMPVVSQRLGDLKLRDGRAVVTLAKVGWPPVLAGEQTVLQG